MENIFQNKDAKKVRIYYLDVLRVIACLAVVMIHSSAGFVVKNIGSVNFWIGNLFDSLSRIGVPIFIMIPGALMLDENYDFSFDKMFGHITKIVLFFVFCSIMIQYKKRKLPGRQKYDRCTAESRCQTVCKELDRAWRRETGNPTVLD